MDFMKAFMDQNMIAMMGEIVLFANTVTMAMPTRWRDNMMMDMVCQSFLIESVYRKVHTGGLFIWMLIKKKYKK